MPNPVKWITNVGKSISYSFIDEMKELNPTLNAFKEDNGDFVKSVKSTLSIKSIKESGRSLNDNQYFKLAKDTIDNLKDDLRTGKLYNREREKTAMDKAVADFIGFDDSDFGFGDFDDGGDFGFDEDISDSIDESTKSTNDMVDLVGEKTSKAISGAVIGSSEYMAKVNRKNTKVLFDQNNILFSRLHSDMGTVNANISSILKFAQEATTTHYNNSATFYSNMTSKMEETNSLLKELVDIQKKAHVTDQNNTPRAKNRISDIMGSEGVPNLEAWKDQIKKNLKDNSYLDMLNMGMEMGLGAQISSTPGKFITDTIAKVLTPKSIKEAMKGFNNTLSGVFSNILMDLSNNAGDMSLKGILGSIFGIDNSLKTDFNTGNYKKDAVPFDGVTKKAITEVIPTYLSKILVAVSNANETTYDYDRGKFVSKKYLKQDYDDITRYNAQSAFSDMSSYMRDKAGRFQFDKDDKGDFITKKQLEKNLEEFLIAQYKAGKVFNDRKDTIDASTYSMSGGKKAEISARVIQDIWKKAPRQLKVKLAGELMSRRESQTNDMMRRESEGIDPLIALFNNSDKAFGQLKLAKESGDDPLKNINKYNSNILDVLVDIRKEVSYIREFGVSGRRGKGRVSKKNFKDYNPYQMPTPKEEETYYQSIWENDVINREDQEELDDYRERVLSIDRQDQARKDRANRKKGPVESFLGFFSKSGASIGAAVDNTLNTPIKFLTGVINKADQAVYSLVFGSDDNNPDHVGILERIGNGIKNTFEKVDTWLNENIFEPLKEKFTKENIKNATKKFFGIFGIDIEDIGKRVKKFLFGEKDKDGNRIDNGKFGGFIDRFKKAGKDAAGWVKGSAKEAYKGSGLQDAVEGELNEQGQKKQDTRNEIRDIIKGNDDKIKAILSGKKSGKDQKPDVEGQAATGIKRVPKTGVYALSEGEAVIPPDYNPSNIKRRYANEARAIDRYKKHGNISMFAEGGIAGEEDDSDFKDLQKRYPNATEKELRKVLDLRNENAQWRKELRTTDAYQKDDYNEDGLSFKYRFLEEFANFGDFMKGLFGDIKDKAGNVNTDKMKTDVLEIANTALKDAKEYLPEMSVGALIGGGASLITGMIGGPLVGAAVGSAVGLTIKSEAVQKLLFGDVETDENGNVTRKGGLLPENISNMITKYAPNVGKGAALGGIAGLLPILPVGPIPGILIGSAVGFASRNEQIQNYLFGNNGKLKGVKDKLKTVLPKMGVGAAVGAITSPIIPGGLITNMVLGSAIGLISDTDKFKDVFFGKLDKDGNRIGGVYDKLITAVTKPAKDFIKDNKKYFSEWFQETIKKNLQDIFDPLKRRFRDLGVGIKKLFENMSNRISKALGTTLLNKITTVLNKLPKPINALYKLARGATFGLIGAPFKAIGAVGRGMKASDVRKGKADYIKTAAERLKYREENNVGKFIRKDKAFEADTAINNMSSDQLDKVLKAVKTLKDGSKPAESQLRETKNKLITDISRTGLKSDDKVNIGKLLKNNDFDGIRAYIDNDAIGIDKNTRNQISDLLEQSEGKIKNSAYVVKEFKNGEGRANLENLLKEAGLDTSKVGLNQLERYLQNETDARSKEDKDSEEEKKEKKVDHWREDVINNIETATNAILHITHYLDPNYVGPINAPSASGKFTRKAEKANHDDLTNNRSLLQRLDDRENGIDGATPEERARQRLEQAEAADRNIIDNNRNKANNNGERRRERRDIEDAERLDPSLQAGRFRRFKTLAGYKMQGVKEYWRYLKSKRNGYDFADDQLDESGYRINPENLPAPLRWSIDKGSKAIGKIRSRFNNNEIDGQAAEGLYGVPYSGLYALSKGEYVIPRLAEGTEKPNKNKNSIVLRIMMVGNKLRASLGMDKGKKSRRNKNKGEDSYQGDNEKITTSFYNGLPIKNKVDDNGNVEPDTSDAETVNTLRERDEDRTRQKGIFDSIKNIPSKIGELFGLGKKKEEKKENLLGKILKAAGIAMLAAFFAPKIINFIKKTVAPFVEDTVVPVFKDKILPAMEEKLNNVKNGFLKGFLGDNYEGDNPEGIVGAFGEKIGEGTAALKNFLTDDVLPWITDKAMPAVGNYLEEKAPEILASAITNLPKTILTVGGIFGKTLNLVFGNKNNSGATNTVDTKNLESGKETSMTDEKGNKLTKEDIENKNYNSIYNSEGAKGKVNDDGTVTFTDESNPFVSPLDTIGNAAFHQFIKGKPGKFNKAFQAVMKSKPLELLKKIPGVSVGLKLFSGVSKPLAKGMEFAGNLGSKASTKFAAKFLTETVKTVGENGEEITKVVAKTPKVVKYLDAILDKVKTIVDKLFSNKKSFKKIKELAESLKTSKVSEWISKFKDNVGKIFAKFTKEAASEASEDVVKQTAKKLNLVLTIATAVLDFIKGADQAESILGVTETSIVEEVIAGFVNAVVNAIPLLSLVPNIVSNIAKAIYNLFDDDLEERQKEADKEYQSYKDEGGTYTKEEYLKSKYSTTGKIGLWIEKKKSALFNKFFGKKQEPEGSKSHKSASKEEHGGSVGGSFAAGGTVPYSGLYALSKGEYIIPRLAEGTLNDNYNTLSLLSKVKDNNNILNTDSARESMQKLYDYASTGDDKFYKAASDNNSILKLISLIGRSVFGPVYGIQKMQKNFTKNLSNELGDGDKVLESFNLQLQDTNNFLSGKGSMKNYWNDRLDDNTSILGNMAKTITTIYKTLQFPMILSKSLFQYSSGQSSNDTDNVDAVSETTSTSGSTTTTELNSATDAATSMVGSTDTTKTTTKALTKNTSQTTYDRTQSGINTGVKLNPYLGVSAIKATSRRKNMPNKYYVLVGKYGENNVRVERAANGRNIKKYKVRINGKWVDYSTLGSGSGIYVGGGSYDPIPVPESDTAGNNRTKSPLFKYTEVPTINNAQYKSINTDTSNITPVSENFVSQVTGNISTERFNTSLDTTRQTVADTGCAPAVATMVINSLTGKSAIDMKTAMNDALPYKAQNSGVTSEFFDDEFSKYGISTQYLNNDTSDPKKSSIVRAIKEKRPTILLGTDPTNKNKSSSPFGSSPHYVVADSISKDNQYIYINDPESRKARTKYSLRSVLPRVTVGITTSIGRTVRNAANKLTTYIGRATKDMVKPKSGDYISKYVHQFESGDRGPESIVHCGNDGGLSYGTYQMIWSYNGQPGSAQKFWSTYFASKYGTPSSYNDLKEKWLQAIKDIGKDAFFAKEWEYALNSYYIGTVNTLKSKYGFDPDHYSRAMQECIWSWAIHRGNGGAVSEFGEVAAQFNNKPMEADETKLLNACYDVRYKHVSFPRYGNSASSERSTILALVGQDPIDHTAPDGTAGSSVGTDDSTTSTSNTSGGNKKSILDILLAPFDLLGSDYGLTGSNDGNSSTSGGTTQYNSEGISGTVSSDKNIADKQVKVVSQMNSVYGKLKYAQNNAKYPGSRNPDDGSGDCSSTVEWAYKKALGVEVGGWSGGQATADTTYTVDGGSNGSTTNESNLQLGDILLYGTNAGSHAEMYFGNGKVLTHGNPNALGPTVANVGRRQDYWGARRLKEFKSNGTSTFSGSGSGLFGRGSFVSQLDPKYASKGFNISGDTIKQTIGDSGCAPAAATMVLNDIAGRSSMMDNSKLALKYKGNNDGVTADYFSDVYSRNGLRTNYYGNSDQVANDLRRGKDVVLLGSDSKNTSKSNSPFGPNAHYVVASGMSKDGRNITIKDPEANKPKKYSTDKILKHTKLGIGYGSGLVKKLTSQFRKYIGRGFGSYSGILYVGDSRTAMMRDCISEDGVSFIAKVGAGLDWLKSTAAAQVESKMASDPNLAIVFNFGVNDVYRPDQYIKFYQDFKNRHAKANLFFMSVNPVDSDPYCKDSDVVSFNSKLQSFWGNNYLDVYSYLKSDGYKTTDGLHYDNATSKKIHEKVKSMLSGSTSTSSDSSSSSTSGSESVLDKILGGMDNIAEKYGLVVNTGSSNSNSSSSGSTAGSDYPKYNLTDAQINEIATGVTGETGGDSLFESMQEASQMANLNEVTKKRQPTGADMLSTLHSGWYASASFTRGVTETAKDAVRKVFNEGKRTLPRYVTEHDTFPMDITNAKDRSAYKKGDPVSNRYGSNYKFYDFFGQNKEGDISGYFDQDYATYQSDVPWSGTGSGLLNNYPKYKGRGGFNDVMTAFSNYTDQMASSMGLTDSSDSTGSVSDSTKSITKKSDGTSDMTKLMKSVIKLLAKVADNTSDISEIISILSKLVDLQSTQMDNSETKQQWTSLKTDLANKLTSYNKTSTGSGELSNLMDSIESLAME